jgi:hypothetical protein
MVFADRVHHLAPEGAYYAGHPPVVAASPKDYLGLHVGQRSQHPGGELG